MALILLYLAAIVFANLAVTAFGPAVSIVTAFVLIALDLTVRDALHERWSGQHLWRNMLALIGTGSILSALVNANAAPIAKASFLAFLAAGIADTVIYGVLGERSRFVKVNGSNLVSAAVDSFIFPAVAFGFPPLWGIVLGQWVAKVGGGLLWSLVLFRGDPSMKPPAALDEDDDGLPPTYEAYRYGMKGSNHEFGASISSSEWLD